MYYDPKANGALMLNAKKVLQLFMFTCLIQHLLNKSPPCLFRCLTVTWMVVLLLVALSRSHFYRSGDGSGKVEPVQILWRSVNHNSSTPSATIWMMRMNNLKIEQPTNMRKEMTRRSRQYRHIINRKRNQAKCRKNDFPSVGLVEGFWRQQGEHLLAGHWYLGCSCLCHFTV